jgi:hypothetical protein
MITIYEKKIKAEKIEDRKGQSMGAGDADAA